MEMVLENLSKQQFLQLVYNHKQAISHQENYIVVQGAALLNLENNISAYKEAFIVKEKEIAHYKKDNTNYKKDNARYQKENTRYEKDHAQYQGQIAYLKEQVAQLRRMLFGQKRERFTTGNTQLTLPFEVTQAAAEKQAEVTTQKMAYNRRVSTHKGRVKLPGHLPVKEIEIYPEGDLTNRVCIGKEITEELECVPARFFIRRYIRYKYAHKNGEGVMMGALPERVIDKGIPGAGLLSMILTDKYMDHLPLYRQKQRFTRADIPIASSTLDGWTKEALLKLEPLYDQLVFDTRSKGYLQVDETVCLEAA